MTSEMKDVQLAAWIGLTEKVWPPKVPNIEKDITGTPANLDSILYVDKVFLLVLLPTKWEYCVYIGSKMGIVCSAAPRILVDFRQMTNLPFIQSFPWSCYNSTEKNTDQNAMRVNCTLGNPICIRGPLFQCWRLHPTGPNLTSLGI